MSEFDILFRKYYHRLFCYAMKFVENEGDAHNMVQDIFTGIFEKQIFVQQEGYIKAYLYNGIRNSCLNHIKHQKVINRHLSHSAIELKETELTAYLSTEKSMIEEETFMKIHQAIEELSPSQKEVLLLSRFEGMKSREIAEKLQIPVRTVETRIFRALSALRKKLSPNNLFMLLLMPAKSKFHEDTQSAVISTRS
jgi:RNA polymerase sigma-70 factor, ECF subfamily